MKTRLFISLFFIVIKVDVINAGRPLIYNLAQGHEYYYTVESSGTRFTLDGYKKGTFTYHLHFTVKGISKGAIKLQVTFDRFYYIDSLESFDTDAGWSDKVPPYPAYLAGKSIDLAISKYGDFLSIEGISSLADSISRKYYNNTFMEKMKAFQYIKDDLVNNTVKPIFLKYSEKNSENWNDTIVKKLKVPVSYSRKKSQNNNHLIKGIVS